MQIDKQQIIEFLQKHGNPGSPGDPGDPDKVIRAQTELPDQVDTDQHADLLGKFGINPQELLGKLGGSLDGSPGGLGGKLGL